MPFSLLKINSQTVIYLHLKHGENLNKYRLLMGMIMMMCQ